MTSHLAASIFYIKGCVWSCVNSGACKLVNLSPSNSLHLIPAKSHICSVNWDLTTRLMTNISSSRVQGNSLHFVLVKNIQSESAGWVTLVYPPKTLFTAGKLNSNGSAGKLFQGNDTDFISQLSHNVTSLSLVIKLFKQMRWFKTLPAPQNTKN